MTTYMYGAALPRGERGQVGAGQSLVTAVLVTVSGPYVMLGLLFTAVLLPLAANTVATVLLANWTSQTRSSAQKWLSDTPGAEVISVEAQSRTLYVHVRSPGGLPPISDLLSALEGHVPNGIPIVVDATRGQQIQAGKVGG
ncbi:hypothetical protein LUR56_01625 [Streptomyces sp. MT29]|nr:hypothetical protein [Streptomyces sp. MT29]